MKALKPKLSVKLAPRQKKLLAIAGVMAIVVIFISFLLSLSSDQTATPPQASAPSSGTLTPAGNESVTQPAAERYDYVNMLNEPPAEAADSSAAASGSLNPPAASPFAKDAVSDSGTLPQPTAEPPAPANNAAPEMQPAKQPLAAKQAILYCDSFATENEAESRKAMIAFQGISSRVTAQGNTIVLAIGPFADREAARSIFSNLAEKGLVTQCSLTDVP